MAENGIGWQINIMAKVTDLTLAILALTSMLMAMTLLSMTLTSNIDIAPYNVNDCELYWLTNQYHDKSDWFDIDDLGLDQYANGHDLAIRDLDQ